jgi:hypothetical protein
MESRFRSVWQRKRTPPERPLEIIKEHDRIVLTAPIATESLEMADVGPVVHVYTDGRAFEIEFTTLHCTTAAVRPVTRHEITHSRELTGGVTGDGRGSERGLLAVQLVSGGRRRPLEIQAVAKSSEGATSCSYELSTGCF